MNCGCFLFSLKKKGRVSLSYVHKEFGTDVAYILYCIIYIKEFNMKQKRPTTKKNICDFDHEWGGGIIYIFQN